jgi:hypothetical protein
VDWSSLQKFGDVWAVKDLGGGPGTYAMAFLARYPKLQAAICDRPAAAGSSQGNCCDANARKPLSYLPLNFMEKTCPDGTI